MTSAERAQFVRLAAAPVDIEDLADRLSKEVLAAPENGTSAEVWIDRPGAELWLVIHGTDDLDTGVDALLELTGLTDRVRWRWTGEQAIGIVGPDLDRRPALAAVAVRHLRDRASAQAVLGLLRRSGDEWKQEFPGFVAATPFLGLDGMTLVNYPRWTSWAAYTAWMAEPRMRAGQQEVGAYEAAEPQYYILELRSRRHFDHVGSKR